MAKIYSFHRKSSHLNANKKAFLIGLMVLYSLFLINFVIANYNWGTLNTYDNYPSSTINSSLWFNTTTDATKGTINQTANIKLFVQTPEGSDNIILNVTASTKNLTNLSFIKNITFYTDFWLQYCGGLSYSPFYQRLYIFGYLAYERSTINDNDCYIIKTEMNIRWDIYKNGSQFDIYKGGGYQTTITPNGNQIVINMFDNTGGGGFPRWGNVSIYKINYSYIDNIFNYSMIIPSNNSLYFEGINSASIPFNISINVSSPARDQTQLKNITLFINGIRNSTNLISGLNNYTNFTKNLTLGNYNYSFYICDNGTYCSYTNTLYFSIQSYNVTSQFYNNQTIEGSTEIFNISITIPSGATYQSTYLNYDGVSYLASFNNVGNNYYLSKSLNIPYVTSDRNISFFWILNFGGLSYNTTKVNQTVRNIAIDDCSSYSNLIFNFTFYDQGTKAPINSTLDLDLYIAPFGTTTYFLNYSKAYNSTVLKKVCINIPLNQSVYSYNMIGGYQASGYAKQFYYADNITLTNATSPHKQLYDLLLTDSTTFFFSYSNSAGNGVPNAIIHVYRYYIGEGLFREVENGKLDSSSSTHLHLVEEDVIYYFTVTYNNALLYTSPTYNAVCLSAGCPVTLSQLVAFTPFPVNWDVYNGTAISTISNKTSRIITLYFVSDNVHTINMSLLTVSDGQQTLINQTSLTATTGTLSLFVPYPYGNQTFYLIIYQDNQYIRYDLINMKISGKDLFGNFGIFLIILLIACLILIASTEGLLVIVFSLVGLIISVLLYFLDMGWVTLVSIIIAGGLLIWKISQRKK